MTEIRFFDPLYGPIALDELCSRLVFTPEMQRLRYVRLCNMNSLFLTGASEPKRFEHSLGVMKLAQEWLRRNRLTKKEAEVIAAAALLHDLQTAPFGHSLQYIFDDNKDIGRFSHDDFGAGVQDRAFQLVVSSASFAGRIFSAPSVLGSLADAVFEAIRGEGPFGPLIAGSIDLDNIDNVVRLSFHMGIGCAGDKALPLRLAEFIKLDDHGLCAPSAARFYLEKWCYLRSKLYTLLLLDHGEFAAKAMLTLALEQGVQAEIVGPDSWIMTDEELLHYLEQRSRGEHQFIGEITRRLRVGDLFECVGLWQRQGADPYDRISSVRVKRAIESDVAARATAEGVGRLRLCLHFIKDDRKTCRRIALREIDTGGEIIVGENSDELLVGLFVTNFRSRKIRESEREVFTRCLFEVLERFGVDKLIPIDDPVDVGKVDVLQADLFGE